MNEQVMQPTENALSVNEITSSIVADLLPIGGNTIKALWMKELERRFQIGQERLLEAVTERGISELNEEQLKFYVPASLQFFERVRLAEYEHNINILAEMIAHELFSEVKPKSEFLRYSRILEGLSALEVRCLGASITFAKKLFKMKNQNLSKL